MSLENHPEIYYLHSMVSWRTGCRGECPSRGVVKIVVKNIFLRTLINSKLPSNDIAHIKLFKCRYFNFCNRSAYRRDAKTVEGFLVLSCVLRVLVRKLVSITTLLLPSTLNNPLSHRLLDIYLSSSKFTSVRDPW